MEISQYLSLMWLSKGRDENEILRELKEQYARLWWFGHRQWGILFDRPVASKHSPKSVHTHTHTLHLFGGFLWHTVWYFFCFINAFYSEYLQTQLYGFPFRKSIELVQNGLSLSEVSAFRTIWRMFYVCLPMRLLALIFRLSIVVDSTINSLKELPLTLQQLGVNWCRFVRLVYLFRIEHSFCSGQLEILNKT